MSSISHLSFLPVFQLLGGTEVEQKEFVQRLMTALQQRSLCSAFVKSEECQTQSQYAIFSKVKLCDLVLIDSEIDLPAQQIHLGDQNTSLLDRLAWTGGDDIALQRFTDRLVKRTDELVLQTPVWGCILIGGKSSRMGRPKHLIEDKNKITWLQRTAAILRPFVDGLLVSGTGMLPEKLADTKRLVDIPGVVGPLTGMLSASRWQPMVSWLLVACDMPYITTEAIEWLLSERRSGCWGRVPRLAGRKHCEPLFAWYDFRAGQIFEEQAWTENLRIGAAASHPKIDNPLIPEWLNYAWQNINTPDQL